MPCGNHCLSALQYVFSRGLSEVLLAPLGRVYLSEIVSEFGPKTHWLISTQERLWQRCLFKYLRCEPEEHHVLLTEPPLKLGQLSLEFLVYFLDLLLGQCSRLFLF